MARQRLALIAFPLLFALLCCLPSCDTSTDPKSQDLDLSQITETGVQGPGDFIGNIDLSDWTLSSYNSIVFRRSFWIQKYSASDTLFFGGRSSGDSIGQSLKVYNAGNATLMVTLHPPSPFFAMRDSVVIPPLTLGKIGIYFILPDTSNTVHSGAVTLRCSTQDSVVLKLQGYRVRPDTGGVVVSGPTSFSLLPAYPNPTDGEIRFEFAVPETTDVALWIVNKKNEVVGTIAQGIYRAGLYSVSWNANLSNGTYRAVFRAGSYTSKGDIQVLR